MTYKMVLKLVLVLILVACMIYDVHSKRGHGHDHDHDHNHGHNHNHNDQPDDKDPDKVVTPCLQRKMASRSRLYCDSISPAERVQCGSQSTEPSKPVCLEEGCCFDERKITGQIQCFHPSFKVQYKEERMRKRIVRSVRKNQPRERLVRNPKKSKPN